MKANLEELGEMLTELFKQQCDLDIQKAMVKHFIKEKQAEQLTLNGVVKSLPQDNYCNVCNLPTDGEKCYSKRCPV